MDDLDSLRALGARFPETFAWGVASSAFQIEGAANSDGKGPSIWDEFCRRPGAIADGSDGTVACDHYHRLESDLDLIAALGVRAYRFSIAWSRIQPTGSDAINPAGLNFYQRLVDGLLERDIEPYLTLYHWDLPAALQQAHNGWADRQTAYRFAEYAGLIARHLGDRVRSFTTHNEPWVTATLGHETGIFAPGLKDRRIATQASHNVLLSHGLAAQAIRGARGGLEVGIVLNLSPVYPASDSAEDQLQAERDDGFLLRWYMDALLEGQYPADVIEALGSDAPVTQPEDANLIAQPLDFLGINYYYPITATAGHPFCPTRAGVPVTDMGWEVAPQRLTDLLLRLDGDYELPALMVTENGAAFRDTLVDGVVQDEDRRAYIESHVRAIAAAIEAGVDVRGYFVWSLFDNFEWASGYAKRFGIYYVDYATQKRVLKRSGEWFKAFMEATAHP